MWMDEEVFRLLYWWYSLEHNVEKRFKHFSTEHKNKLFLLDNSIKSLPVLVCLIKFGAQLIQPRAMGEAGTKFGSFISCGCELRRYSNELQTVSEFQQTGTELFSNS